MSRISVHAVTPDRWKDLETIFGPRGACAGCWCMFFKLTGAEFDAGRGAKNKASLKRCVARGDEPGLLAYVDDQPAGWCSVEPKGRFGRVMRSRKLGGTAGDETQSTWAIPCFFVARGFRRRGVSVALLEAASAHARRRGATLVEGYPVAPLASTGPGALPDTFAFHGTVAAFERAGFEQVAAPSKSRRVMWRRIGP